MPTGLYIERVREIKSQIKDRQFQNYSVSKIRSRAESLCNDEKPSKFFFQQEIKRAKQKNYYQNYNGVFSYCFKFQRYFDLI